MAKSSPPSLLISSIILSGIFFRILANPLPFFLTSILFAVAYLTHPAFFRPILFLIILIPVYIIVRFLFIGWGTVK
ncbi:MAG: hypothetical protein ACFFER_12525 [Candidatus Thorarchaeota archaeon]